MSEIKKKGRKIKSQTSSEIRRVLQEEKKREKRVKIEEKKKAQKELEDRYFNETGIKWEWRPMPPSPPPDPYANMTDYEKQSIIGLDKIYRGIYELVQINRQLITRRGGTRKRVKQYKRKTKRVRK